MLTISTPDMIVWNFQLRNNVNVYALSIRCQIIQKHVKDRLTKRELLLNSNKNHSSNIIQPVAR